MLVDCLISSSASRPSPHRLHSLTNRPTQVISATLLLPPFPRCMSVTPPSSLSDDRLPRVLARLVGRILRAEAFAQETPNDGEDRARRQSTPDQVREHRESTERQYALTELAMELGWPREQVWVLDRDLGTSGTTSSGRDDFHALCAAVGLGKVGAVLALEMSRLSRSEADWHRLLDLCAWTQTLLIDHDGVYDPNDFNDRVLLGFKGSWSATELHAMRNRLAGGRRHAAKQGRYRQRPPAGYTYDAKGVLVLDPDEGVVDAIRSVFRDFRRLGSAYAVASDHAKRGMVLPRRSPSGCGELGLLEWTRPRPGRVTAILNNPTYAGAYVHGKRPSRPVVRDGVLVGTRQVTVPPEDWAVVIRDAHVGYVSWQEYQDNQRLLTMNRTWTETDGRRGRPRGGAALLQGLILCGRCGRRMRVAYRGNDGRSPAYVCPRRHTDPRPVQCWSTAARPIDTAVERHVLDQVTADNLDVSLQVLHELEADQDARERSWKLRLERARQEATRAERQFDLVEPENRLVARSLERRWEEKLTVLAELEQAYEKDRHREHLVITPEQRRRILQLARNLPAVWHAATTRAEDRKELLGLLIKQAALVPEDLPEATTRILLLWHQGTTTELVVPRPRGVAAVRTAPQVLARIQQLMPDHTDAAIAAILDEDGQRTGRGRRFTATRVAAARHRHALMRHDKDKRAAGRVDPREDGLYSTVGLAHLAGVRVSTVHYWRKKGRIKGIQEHKRGAWWYEATPEVLATLRTPYPRKRHDPQRGAE
jgi:DNA invertase Pin-like site-specific DNA recombinase